MVNWLKIKKSLSCCVSSPVRVACGRRIHRILTIMYLITHKNLLCTHTRALGLRNLQYNFLQLKKQKGVGMASVIEKEWKKKY